MEGVKRTCNTDKHGNPWMDTVKKIVWCKAIIIPNYSIDEYRLDQCGRILCFEQFNNRDHKYGWVVDHIIPVIHGGEDDYTNLQPLHWNTNLKKGDNLDWICPE